MPGIWRSGERAVVIERRYIGGSCPNTNCLPSKNEIWSAKVADLARHRQKFGVQAADVAIDMASVRQRKRDMIDGLIKMHLDNFAASGAELVMGHAKFIGPKMVEVSLNEGGTRTFEAERVFVNVGSRATLPEVPGLADAKPMTHIEILELDRLPEHLIVIGGGYVGLEFAQAYRRFGSRVTLLQHGPQLLSDQDPDVATEMERLLTADGIRVVTSAELLRVSGQSGENVRVTILTSDGEQLIEGSDLLVAAGRTPNTQSIGLEIAGVELQPNGTIRVNDRLETSAANVWAIGECAGSPQFTHASFDDFRIIRDNLAGGQRGTHDRLMPSCLFTDPQVAHIGLTEKEAARQKVAVRVTKMPTAGVLRTRTTGENQGFMKALIGEDDRIIGFTMIGPEAGEVMAVVEIAMLAKLPFTVLRDAVLAHPTMAEGLNALFSKVPPSATSV
ncbi:MAG: FAD-dependent oxidoreductase [Tepidisphaeraceae bacterium]